MNELTKHIKYNLYNHLSYTDSRGAERDHIENLILS